MEQPPGSLEDLQPQDLSTSSIPAGIDLTRKGEECVLDSPTLDALHMVKSPSWYPNLGTSNPGLPFSETGSSETTLQSGEPIQPDDAFSHTTVTLSYVSRSCVFSAHDSLSRRSPLYGVPPISKMSLHSPCDFDIGLEETGYALNQHYLEQVDGPIDLATQTHLFQSLAQVGPEKDGRVCLTQEPQELISSGREKHGNHEEDYSLSLKKSGGLENGQGGSCSSSMVCAEISPETITSATGVDEERVSSKPGSLTSKKWDPVVASGSVGARDLSSQGREYISPLEDPVSPSATSLDNVEDVFILPQASSSPSGDNCYLETFNEVAGDGLRTKGAIQPGCGISNRTTKLDSRAKNKQPVSRRKTVLEPLIDLTDEKSQGKGKATGSKPFPTSKTKGAGTRKRRQRKRTSIQYPSIFSPKEPEIKLKYINHKEEKRDYRLDRFSPFIHVERQQTSSSLCSIINYPEEVRTQHKRGPQQQVHPCGFIDAVVPSTSCLQLGRASSHSLQQRALVCCLCGQAANAMDLGDLHGPYYPEGYQPGSKRPASMSGLKEDEDGYSDTDSSSCSVRGRGRKSAVPAAPGTLKPAAQLKRKVLESYRRTANNTGIPAAKRARSEGGSADMADWYSPPVLPLEPCEYWLHEDCGIWSAGVFLVKGKVYGLEEAVKVAEETKCSACSDRGATLGCFFKGCVNKYHYRCALESDCVLVEDIFSMKCKKHKNKTFRAPPGNRWEDR
ncbi:Transcription factor 20 [Liparis tanakae]|uniref:Transcription factor 20 n=1 Tax=Liparis tanakae TaxID=230148 RepID=A0A4Z2IUW1_9TELE|nr:Transcription factor 20 [Liparis tanakae]